ncbi:type IV pilin protein [Ramlibacter sp. AN1015]|uniref:type IV pilin protein n=1 Tax=Ramlibacter sp. AN1015 TaxID=3133428 RepID=UPI0030BB2C16
MPSRPTVHALHRMRGFTLIELMITVAIIAILSSIAYPSYQSHVRSTRRALATACLQELAQQLERRYTITMTYVDAAAPMPVRTCVGDLAGHYRFQFATGQPTAGTFTVEAVPEGPQLADAGCGKLGLRHTGLRERGGTADVKSCWR